MKKKGQVGLGLIMIMFITIIVGVVLFQVVAQEVGSSTNTVVINQTETAAADGGIIYIGEWKSISDVTILNVTDHTTYPAGNYTITNDVINPTTGALSFSLTTNSVHMANSPIYIQGTAQPVTYISDSGSRAMAGLIVIMFALAIAVVVIGPIVQNEFMNLVGS